MERQQTRHHHQPKLCKGRHRIATIQLQTYLFAPYRGEEEEVIDLAVGASPHPILLYPYGVETQQIKPRNRQHEIVY